MKPFKLLRAVLIAALALIIASFGMLSAYADREDGDSDQQYEDYDYRATPDEAVDEDDDDDSGIIGFIDNYFNPDAAEFVPPTVAKTVSEKNYTTNNAAGIASWICVLVGTTVLAVVIISTKAGGRKREQGQA